MVDDLMGGINRWIDLGIGPWRVWTFDDRMLSSRTYRGAPGSYAARVALCSTGPLTYELIEPLRGPSIWDGFLAGRHSRMHHLGYYVDHIGDAIAAMAEQGFEAVQTGAGFGSDGDGAFAYFDTMAAFGHYFEAIASPSALPEPEEEVSLTSKDAGTR